MSKNIMILIGVLLSIAVIAIVVYFVGKKTQNKKDRENLEGMTREEFFDMVRPAWEEKWRAGMQDYLSEVNYSVTWESKKYPKPDGGYFAPISLATNWQAQLYNKSILEGRPLQEIIDETIDWAWEEGQEPMKIDWAREYWLPTFIDNLGLNYNNELIQKLIYKI